MDTEWPNPHFIYPISQEAIGDDYGEYVYANPVKCRVRTTMLYVMDCWIVNIKGERHPGYSDSPVPVRREHLGDHIKGASV